MSAQKLSLKEHGKSPVSTNFIVEEFRSKCGSDVILIDIPFVQKYLQRIRDHFGKSVTIVSAYRSPEHNAKVGGSKNSNHMQGTAFDIRIYGVTPKEIAQYAQSIGVLGVIVYKGFCHIDTRTVKYFAYNNDGKVTVVNSFVA